MSRLYSGNANDYRHAIEALTALGFSVQAREFNDQMRQCGGIALRVTDLKGNTYGADTFTHWDFDVLYNTATSWLNNMYDQLKTWS